MFLLIGFVVLAGASASVVRAAAMGAVTLLALATGRPRAALPALGAAVCVLLLLDPGLARDAGFALSVAATAAIVLPAPTWSRHLRSRGCWPVLADALAVSAAAGLATAPLVAGLSGSVSLVSLPANSSPRPRSRPRRARAGGDGGRAGDPMLEDLLVWCPAGRRAGWWWSPNAPRHRTRPPAGRPGGQGRPADHAAPGGGVVALAVSPDAAARAGRAGGAGRDRLALQQAVEVAAADASSSPATSARGTPSSSRPGRRGVLVDAGPDVGAVDRCLDRLGIDVLPLVLMSHLDADHAGGLAGALAGREVGVVATGTLAPSDEREGVRQPGPGQRRRTRGAGARRPPDGRDGDDRGARPGSRAGHRGRGGQRPVDGRPDHPARRADPVHRRPERPGRARILASGTDLGADVLKVPHHGSGDADPAFLAASGARVALISVGADNTYGHPAPASHLAGAAGMRVHRTDRDGDLAVVGSAASWGVAVRDGDGRGTAAAAGGPEPAGRCRPP